MRQAEKRTFLLRKRKKEGERGGRGKKRPVRTLTKKCIKTGLNDSTKGSAKKRRKANAKMSIPGRGNGVERA